MLSPRSNHRNQEPRVSKPELPPRRQVLLVTLQQVRGRWEEQVRTPVETDKLSHRVSPQAPYRTFCLFTVLRIS